MDQIIVEELEVYYQVGVPDEERAKAQKLLVSIILEQDFTRAAMCDALGHTINYQAVAERVVGFGQNRSWKLIETLAVDIAEALLREFKPARVTVEIKKFILPKTRHVAVRVTRPA